MSFDSNAAIAATLMLRFMSDKTKCLHRRKKKSIFTENIIMIGHEKVSEKRI